MKSIFAGTKLNDQTSSVPKPTNSSQTNRISLSKFIVKFIVSKCLNFPLKYVNSALFIFYYVSSCCVSRKAGRENCLIKFVFKFLLSLSRSAKLGDYFYGEKLCWRFCFSKFKYFVFTMEKRKDFFITQFMKIISGMYYLRSSQLNKLKDLSRTNMCS